MKIRTGFVSNSSSSSFIVGFNEDIKKLSEEEYLQKYEDMFDDFEYQIPFSEENLNNSLIELKEKFNYEPDINNFKIKNGRVFISKKEVAKYFKVAGKDINNLKKIQNRKKFKNKLILDVFDYEAMMEDIITTLEVISKIKSKPELVQFYLFNNKYLSQIGTLCYMIYDDINDLNDLFKNEKNENLSKKIIKENLKEIVDTIESYFDFIDEAKIFINDHLELKIAMYFNFIIFENEMIKRKYKYIKIIEKISDEVDRDMENVPRLIKKYFNESKMDKYFDKEYSIIKKYLYKNLSYMYKATDIEIINFVKLILKKPKYLKSLKTVFDLDDRYIKNMNDIIKKVKENLQLIDKSKYFYLYNIQGQGDGWDNLISSAMYEDYPRKKLDKIKIGKEIYLNELK